MTFTCNNLKIIQFYRLKLKLMEQKVASWWRCSGSSVAACWRHGGVGICPKFFFKIGVKWLNYYSCTPINRPEFSGRISLPWLQICLQITVNFTRLIVTPVLIVQFPELHGKSGYSYCNTVPRNSPKGNGVWWSFWRRSSTDYLSVDGTRLCCQLGQKDQLGNTKKYKIVLDDVTCSVKANRNFSESCTWQTESDCSHKEDIHLTCGTYIKNGIIIFMCRHAKSCDVVSSHEPTELGLLQMAKW